MICTPPSVMPRAPVSSSPARFAAAAPSCAFDTMNVSADASANAIFPFPGPAPATALHKRELYLRALEQEREEILAAAYSRRSPSPSPCDHGEEEEETERFDERGRQLHFRETVRQRQARLEFLRRQEFARRLAHRGLEDAKASAYAIKRLPPPRARPIERVNAAIKIQRFFRLHRSLSTLHALTARIHAAHAAFLRDSEAGKEEAWRCFAERLHVLLKELGESTGVLASSGSSSASTRQQTLHPRVRAAARTAMEALRAELAFLDRAQLQVQLHPARSYSPPASSSSSSSSDSDSEDEFDEYYEDEDYEESEDEDEYASYTYPPSPPPSNLIHTSLYVVDEEDEDEDGSYSYYDAISSLKTPQGTKHHQRSRHAPISSPSPSPVPVPVNVPPLVRSPVARSPSLASIPEEGDEE